MNSTVLIKIILQKGSYNVTAVWTLLKVYIHSV